MTIISTFFLESSPGPGQADDCAGFRSPPAMTIISGLLFAIVLTLAIVPAMCAIVYAREKDSVEPR
jgi:multidrug efflux pump subunit AcrB